MSGFFSLKNIYLRYTAIFLAIVYVLLEARQNNDFVIFLAASENLIHKINLYDVFYKGCYRYYYSPLFALALYPLTLIPVYFAKLIWLLLNLVFVFRTWKAMSFFLNRRVFNERQKLFFTVVSFLFVLYFLTENFHCGQMTLFILFLATEGMYRIMTGRYWFGALLIAIAINIKLLPLLLLPYLLYRRYLKASAWLVLFSAALLILPAPVIGVQYNTVLLKSWWGLINPTHKEHVIDTAERSFHSLSSWLPGLLMDHVDDPHVLPIRRNIASLDARTVELILNSFRAILLIFGLYFLRTLPFCRAASKLKAFRELAYLFLLVPLLFPHQQHYAFYFMLPACTYMCYFLATQYVASHKTIPRIRYRMLLAGMCIVFLTNNLQLLLGEFGPYYEHFKIITCGALVMIPMLALADPDDVPANNEESEREKGPGFY